MCKMLKQTEFCSTFGMMGKTSKREFLCKKKVKHWNWYFWQTNSPTYLNMYIHIFQDGNLKYWAFWFVSFESRDSKNWSACTAGSLVVEKANWRSSYISWDILGDGSSQQEKCTECDWIKNTHHFSNRREREGNWSRKNPIKMQRANAPKIVFNPNISTSLPKKVFHIYLISYKYWQTLPIFYHFQSSYGNFALS